MSVAVIVPRGGDCPHREQAWCWLRARYEEHWPEWELIEAGAPNGPSWVKALAVNPVVERCDAEIVIQVDADVWCEGLDEAVAAVEGGAPWALPHLMVHRLSEEGTAAVLMGGAWQEQPLAQRPYRGVLGGGIVVARRNVLRAAPLDSRFRTWGQEDEAHAMALNALVGQPWRGDAPLWHLWHPPQERMTRRRGSRESWALCARYRECRADPAAMAALIEEGRDVDPQVDHHSMHADPALDIG